MNECISIIKHRFQISTPQNLSLRASLVVQWLRFWAPNAGSMVWALVRELRSHMLQLGYESKKKKKITSASLYPFADDLRSYKVYKKL